MREILFRGKRLDNGEWVEGFYFIDERDIEDGVIWRDVPQIQQRYGDHYDYFDVDPLTVGQFTGLTDKNGKKIFEGDRINRKDKQATVVFDDSEFSLAIDGNEFVQHGLLVDVWKNDLEVIGTIHDKQNGGD